MNVPDFPQLGFIEFPMLDFDALGAQGHELDFLIVPPNMNDLDQGNLLW